MRLLTLGCSYRTTPVAFRERLAFDDAKLAFALEALNQRLDCEAVIVSTCNRVELYLGQMLDGQPGAAARDALDPEEITDFLADLHGVDRQQLRAHVYTHRQADAVRHLFRVAASLDSLIVGEGQIAGQVKTAFEAAQRHATAGALLHTLFRHARQVARRVHTETGIAHGHVSVSSAAVDYVRQVFDHFGDKTVLVIGAGKMGELTLRHLRQLRPQRIVVTNRSPEKAVAVARGCGGEAAPWDKLDELLARADIVLSTTGAPEPIVSRARYRTIAARRTGGPVVILDIAVPRDFDPAIHDGDRTCLFNIDDLKRIREATLADRLKHVGPAEAIVEQELQRFLSDWRRRRNGPVIARLTQEFEAKRQEIVQKLLDRLNGRLDEADRKYIDGAFRLLQNQLLHGPITALAEESFTDSGPPSGHTLLDALRKLFRLTD
jgi:glutamyl-tRNA reductase